MIMKTIESKLRGKERDKKSRPENDTVNSTAVREMKKVKRDEPPMSNEHLSPPKKRALDSAMSPKKQSPSDFYHVSCVSLSVPFILSVIGLKFDS